jgi:hypothetical protein
MEDKVRRWVKFEKDQPLPANTIGWDGFDQPEHRLHTLEAPVPTGEPHAHYEGTFLIGERSEFALMEPGVFHILARGPHFVALVEEDTLCVSG